MAKFGRYETRHGTPPIEGTSEALGRSLLPFRPLTAMFSERGLLTGGLTEQQQEECTP